MLPPGMVSISDLQLSRTLKLGNYVHAISRGFTGSVESEDLQDLKQVHYVENGEEKFCD